MSITRNKLIKEYNRQRVVDKVNFVLERGEIVGLLGPNGAGKTTTFYMVVGLIKPLAGEIFLDEQDITHLPVYKRARRGLGYLSQEPSVFRKLSVAGNIMAILEARGLGLEESAGKAEELMEEFRSEEHT